MQRLNRTLSNLKLLQSKGNHKQNEKTNYELRETVYKECNWEGTNFKNLNIAHTVLVAKSCPTLWDPMDCSLPGSSLHAILQTRTLEWVTILVSMDSSYNSIKKKKQPILKMDKFSTVNRNLSWCSYYGKQYAKFLETKNMVYHMIWYHMTYYIIYHMIYHLILKSHSWAYIQKKS